MIAEKYRTLLDYLIFLQPQISHLITMEDIELHQLECKELETLAEIGLATEFVFTESKYPMALCETSQIDCTQGPLYVTDTDNLIDLYNALKPDEEDR